MTEPTETLTDDQIFDQIATAIREDDHAKLSSLTKDATTPAEAAEESNSNEGEVEETPTPTQVEETSPPNEADDKEDENTNESEQKEEPSELDKLRSDLTKLREENHKLKSNAGRVPNIQHRLREMDKRLEELTKSQTSPSSRPATKIKSKVDDLLKDIREADADLADTLSNAIVEATASVAEDTSTRELESLRAMRDVEAQAYHEQEVGRLLERYPNAPEVFASNHWSSWRDSQPAGVKALAESGNADEVAIALELYAKDMVAKYPELQQKPATTSQSPSNEANEQAKNIEEGRKRRQAQAASVTNPNAPVPTEQDEDLSALFEKYSRDIRKDRTGV